MIKFIDCSQSEIKCNTLFPLVRLERVLHGGETIAYIGWRHKHEPHIEYLYKPKPVVAYRAMLAFMNRDYGCDVNIMSLPVAKNLFDRMCSKTRLKYRGVVEDDVGRGLMHHYFLGREV